MSLTKRLAVMCVAVILTVVTYCAQSCFDLDAAKPICPKHHQTDCCKDDFPVSCAALQKTTPFVSTSATQLPVTLFNMPQIAVPPMDGASRHSTIVIERGDHSAASYSPILRI
jgi:hypothetical protein